MISLVSSIWVWSSRIANAETWLSSHSFAEPLSASLRNDWMMGGQSWPDVNGLTLTKENKNEHGWIASKAPLQTNTFQVMMAVTVTSDPQQDYNAGDRVEGDPGMMLLIHDRTNKPWPPQDGDFYGLYPSIDGHGVFFALTSREHNVSPSISFGSKSLARIQTPLPRGIYWNYLDKKEFEVMLDVLDGKEIHGYIRSKSSDRWTQAFSESLPSDNVISPDSHFILSASNGDMGVRYTVSRLSITSQDDNQPGYQKESVDRPSIPKQVAGKEETIADVKEALIQLTELFATELTRSHHFFEEQRNQNKLIMGLLEQIKGANQEGGHNTFEDSITSITAKMENMEKSLSNRGADKKFDDSFSRVESMFHSLARNHDSARSSKNNQMYFMSIILVLVSGGMGYVIYHMKKLEKKHIL